MSIVDTPTPDTVPFVGYRRAVFGIDGLPAAASSTFRGRLLRDQSGQNPGAPVAGAEKTQLALRGRHS